MLGSAACAFQEPLEIAKSTELHLASHFFCSPDNTTKSGVDPGSWTVDIAALPYLHALGGRQTNKVGWLVAVAIGFLSAPTLLGAFAVAAVVTARPPHRQHPRRRRPDGPGPGRHEYGVGG